MIKIAHFSDIHLRCGYQDIPAFRFLSKRLMGLVNLKFLGREKLFRSGTFVFTQMLSQIAEEKPDHVILSGDITTLAFEQEFEMALEKFQILGWDGTMLSAVPGNHDYYTQGSARQGRFEHFFARYIRTDLPQSRVSGQPYPYVKFLSQDVALIGVNSAKASVTPWDSSGQIGKNQLIALERVLNHPEVTRRFSILVTHYAPFRETGKPDNHRHGLSDRQAFLDLLRKHPVNLLVHGHIHRNYLVPSAIFPVCISNSGSATHCGREHYNIYTIDDQHNLHIEVRKYDPEKERFLPIKQGSWEELCRFV